ncbi:MAG TPA: LEA type 2 family protein [Methanoregulaceae archaeon]|nr:LEA type 2 family protein [Methanoregulaceae archaeon]
MHLFYYVLLGVVIVAGVLVISSGLLVKEPVITLDHVAVTSVSIPEIGLNVTLNVDNPNPVGINLKTIVFDVYYQKGNDWIFISHGSGNGIAITPGMNQVTLPVSIKTAEIPGAGLGALLQGEITIQVRGNAIPDVFLISPVIPFNQTVTIPLGRTGA